MILLNHPTIVIVKLHYCKCKRHLNAGNFFLVNTLTCCEGQLIIHWLKVKRLPTLSRGILGFFYSRPDIFSNTQLLLVLSCLPLKQDKDSDKMMVFIPCIYNINAGSIIICLAVYWKTCQAWYRKIIMSPYLRLEAF